MKLHAFAAAAMAAALALSAAPISSAQDTGAALAGAVLEQVYGSYSGSGGFASGDFGYGSSTTLSLALDAKGPRARMSASLETAALDGEAALAAWYLAESGYAPKDELFEPASRPTGGPDILIAARVRTLYVKLDADWASLTLGRQVINYQRGVLWSPTDIFTALDLTGLSPVRLGSDALRASIPIGATGGFDLVPAPGTSPSLGSYSARLSGLLSGVDGALSAARDGATATTFLGADFKADLEVGFYGDLSYALPDSGASGNLRAAAGADWSAGDLIFAAEYYYNGGGSASDALFPGTHNAYASVTWRPSQLLTFSASVIGDIVDVSGTATALASLSAAQNAMVSAYAKAYWDQGKEPIGGLAIANGRIAAVAGQVGATVMVSF